MPLPRTETVSPGPHIDARSTLGAAAFLLDGQVDAIDAVRPAIAAIAKCALKMAAAIREGHRLHYAAAGSSGLMALADVSELRGTFGIESDKLRIHMAGGVPVDANMPGDTEDDDRAAAQLAKGIHEGDVVIVLTASGTTPFALAIARAAQGKGTSVIGIANNPGTPLLAMADEAVCIATPPEVIAGSTRLGAGTAQKAALNLMSTLMGIELGHVYRGEMVNVIADNAKLVRRAVGMVVRIADVSADAAEAAIKQTGGRVKPAILVAVGCTPEEAASLLEQSNGQLGDCLNSLSPRKTNTFT
ncbi:N-acetylmuramic acid 6-phosphate etherase [Shimia gijangensis]|uniref:N-acetylmuramic acid 6-phosphate etherase n=1 Tax=Shimia gijangensis TaxID=1470563 RepID=A0A1M6IUD9_9RHOB|nr:N-acetylmuramic acid 6-phosphate etherase [Shimia gijangensis]SHJ38067.1 N-acetylmuramic acid 6-phosphate etherase [Shimia gijangensis]